MDSHRAHGGRRPRRCREKFRRRSGQPPPHPCHTKGKSCSWPLRVLSLGLRAVCGFLSMPCCPCCAFIVVNHLAYPCPDRSGIGRDKNANDRQPRLRTKRNSPYTPSTAEDTL